MDRQRVQWSSGVLGVRRYKRLHTTPLPSQLRRGFEHYADTDGVVNERRGLFNLARNGLQPPQRILSSICLCWSRAVFTAMRRSARVIQVTSQQFCG